MPSEGPGPTAHLAGGGRAASFRARSAMGSKLPCTMVISKDSELFGAYAILSSFTWCCMSGSCVRSHVQPSSSCPPSPFHPHNFRCKARPDGIAELFSRVRPWLRPDAALHAAVAVAGLSALLPAQRERGHRPCGRQGRHCRCATWPQLSKSSMKVHDLWLSRVARGGHDASFC